MAQRLPIPCTYAAPDWFLIGLLALLAIWLVWLMLSHRPSAPPARRP